MTYRIEKSVSFNIKNFKTFFFSFYLHLEYAQLFAALIARTAKDVDVLIDSLPSEESTAALQVSTFASTIQRRVSVTDSAPKKGDKHKQKASWYSWFQSAEGAI